MIFRARQFEFTFPRPALVMGIVNVTPDSFSDGGRFLNPEAAVAHALELAGQGADILDIGGESTRPGAEPVSEAEELRRVIPVIEKLAAAVKIPLSIDTMKPAVAHAALQAGASIVNDVAANRQDDAMWRVVGGISCRLHLHARAGHAANDAEESGLSDVVREVGEFFRERLKRLNACGVACGPGRVGSAASALARRSEHNLQLLANLQSFTTLARPLAAGRFAQIVHRKIARRGN